MNKAIVIGNLAKDPDVSVTPNGVAVCKFSLAVNRKFTDKDGNREADFLNIVAWRGLAENVGKYLSKGDKAAVSGSIQVRSYEDKNGERRYVTEIVADDVEFLNTKQAASGGQAGDKPKVTVIPDEDLPF